MLRKKEKIDYSSLLFLLEEGLSIKEILEIFPSFLPTQNEENIGRFFAKNMSVSLRLNFLSFLRFLSLKQALSLSLQIEEKEHTQKEYLRKKLLYPLSLFFISLLGLGLFERFGFSIFINFLASYEKGLRQILFLRTFVKILFLFLFTLSFCFFLFLIALQKKERKILFYRFLCHYFPHNFFTQIVSQEFISYWCICAKAGLGGRDALKVLRQQKQKVFLSFLAYYLENSLEKGEELREASQKNYLDPFFCHFANMAYYHEHPLLFFERYLRFSQQKLEKEIHKMVTISLISIYVFIGFLLMMVYQILWLPMQALSQF